MELNDLDTITVQGSKTEQVILPLGNYWYYAIDKRLIHSQNSLESGALDL